MPALVPASMEPATTQGDAGSQKHDARLIVAARGLRAFGYGFLAVVLAVSLSNAGIAPAAIGVLITVSLAGDFCGTYVIGLYADRWGRRRVLVALALAMAATGLVFAWTRVYPVLAVAAFFGTLGTSGSETAPFLPIEQAMLSQLGGSEQRTRLFARYNLVASLSGALGALAAGLPDVLTHLGVSFSIGVRFMYGAYTVLAVVVAILVSRLSADVEAPPWEGIETTRWGRLAPKLGGSRGIILRLAALFSVDALAGGLIVQSLMALFFHLRFGTSLALLAALFFGANTLSALSFLAAIPLSRRFGLLNTMVFTHLPSNALLVLIAFMPTFPLAAATLLLRQLLSQMDVPTRQAYTMALVAPEERTAAASVTSLSRSTGSALSPIAAGLLLQGQLLTLGLPFIIAGTIKSGYDIALWRIFRRVSIEQ